MSNLDLSGIYFRHLTSLPWILEDLSLHLSDGETALLVGDNGSGKSTLGKLIAGLVTAERGNVLIDKSDLASIEVSMRPKRVVYMGQTSYLQFFCSSIDEEIRFAAKISGAVLSEVYPAYPQFRLPDDRTLKPMDLPYTAMWRLQLFLFSVVFNPSVLFIDEIVAPGARAQMDALEAVVARRSENGQVTILAYQRVLRIEAVPKLRRFHLLEGRLHEM